MKKAFLEKYKVLSGITFPCAIIGLGTIDLTSLPIEVVDEWYQNGKLEGVIELKKAENVPVSITDK